MEECLCRLPVVLEGILLENGVLVTKLAVLTPPGDAWQTENERWACSSVMNMHAIWGCVWRF